MAKIVLKNVEVLIGTTAQTPAQSTPIGTRAKTVSIKKSGPTKDTTCFQDAWESSATGIPAWTATATFLQDYAAGSITDLLDGMIFASSASKIYFRSDMMAATSATNPTFGGNAWLTDYDPIGGSLGEVMQVTATFKGTGALTKYTA